MRRLLTTRRHVPLDIADDYLLAWAMVRRSVQDAGGRAWLFRGAAHEDQFMEFIEWSDESLASVVDDEAVAAAVAQLDAFGHAKSDDWEETA
jgi:hypothetical protein